MRLLLIVALALAGDAIPPDQGSGYMPANQAILSYPSGLSGQVFGLARRDLGPLKYDSNLLHQGSSWFALALINNTSFTQGYCVTVDNYPHMTANGMLVDFSSFTGMGVLGARTEYLPPDHWRRTFVGSSTAREAALSANMTGMVEVNAKDPTRLLAWPASGWKDCAHYPKGAVPWRQGTVADLLLPPTAPAPLPAPALPAIAPPRVSAAADLNSTLPYRKGWSLARANGRCELTNNGEATLFHSQVMIRIDRGEANARTFLFGTRVAVAKGSLSDDYLEGRDADPAHDLPVGMGSQISGGSISASGIAGRNFYILASDLIGAFAARPQLTMLRGNPHHSRKPADILETIDFSGPDLEAMRDATLACVRALNLPPR